jgi:ferrous iron transport protein B
MGLPMVLALNMSDAARRAGHRHRPRVLERELGMPVVETVGIRKGGAHELLQWLDGWRAQAARCPGPALAARRAWRRC